MSGHSKWHNIQGRKNAQDAKRGKIFQKISRDLYQAAKAGDPDPANNAQLRLVIDKAHAANMPKKNIDRAIAKASGIGGAKFEEVTYEGYGPGGMAIMIECLTDNKNRTASFVRSTLTKKGGNLGTDGSVSYLFKRKGLIVLDNSYDEDKLTEDILELDILDMDKTEEGYEITTEPNSFIKVKDSLDNLGYNNYLLSEVTFIPDNYLKLEGETLDKAITLIEQLEDIDDVQSVYHNLDI